MTQPVRVLDRTTQLDAISTIAQRLEGKGLVARPAQREALCIVQDFILGRKVVTVCVYPTGDVAGSIYENTVPENEDAPLRCVLTFGGAAPDVAIRALLGVLFGLAHGEVMGRLA